MRLSHLKRPLFLALFAYGAFLCRLKAEGRFDLVDASDASRSAPREPALLKGRVAALATERRGGQEFLLDVQSIDGSPASGRALARLASADPVDLGDVLTMKGRLSRPPAPLVPGAPSWRGYLATIGVRSIFRADRVVDRIPTGPLHRAVSSFRRRMLGSFRRWLEPADAAVLSGVVLGDKSALARRELDDFRDAGAVYLLVTSGLHVNFVLILVIAALRRAGLPRGPAAAAGLAAGGFYTLAAGAGPPMVRAYAMTVAGAGGWLLDRDSGAFQGLVLAAWALLLLRPSMLFQAGFQMSCAATLAILLAVSYLKPPRSWPLAARRVAEAFLVSSAAQLAMAPLSAAYFHRISLVGFACNAALVPAALALIAAGFALFAASALPWTGAASRLAPAVGAGARCFRGAVAFFAGLPGAAIWAPSPLPAVLGAWGTSPFEVEVSARGASALVSSPEGRLVLVDAGARGEDLAHSVLARGRRSVDEVRLTSLERRSWKGLARFAEIVRVPRVVVPPGRQSPELAAVRTGLEARGAIWTSAPSSGSAEFSWRSLSVTLRAGGPVFDGDFEQFDIVGPFERRPRSAVVLRFDGLVARMDRPS